jgi:hypothetical protein
MKPMRVAILAVLAFAGPAPSADPAPEAAQGEAPPLVVHEWGTFTSFSGSDGVLDHFAPNYTDLPAFVYLQGGPLQTKAGRLVRDGTISMETPVLYFYTKNEMKASVKVDFPRGWITEWYPYAAKAPAADARSPGQSIGWNVKLVPGDTGRLPMGTPRDRDNYFRARDTDAAPLQVEGKEDEAGSLHGGESRQNGVVLQREKFLFYRGVGTFPTPVSIRAFEGGGVRIANDTKTRIDGMILLHVEGSKVGYQLFGQLGGTDSVKGTIPAAEGKKGDVMEAMVKLLTAAGLYEKEARAMVKTWDSAWFGERGTRLLYLVPRSRTDELLPLTVQPKPNETVRVLVGRHDFLTPEQEAVVDRLAVRIRSGKEKEATQRELQEIGRFAVQALAQAEKRSQTPQIRP